jgi:hypothetical protein
MTYYVTDFESGRLVTTVGNVCAPVRLTGAVYTDGSAAVTVADTSHLWSGMLLVGKHVAAGTTVLTVDTATTFTMSAPASGAGSGLILLALGYDPTPRLEDIRVENYRDLYSGLGSHVGLFDDNKHAYAYMQAPEGYGVYADPGQPITLETLTGGGSTVAFLAGQPKVSVSDHVDHVPPRSQTQTITEVRFVCNDGTVVPIRKTPELHIVQAVV